MSNGHGRGGAAFSTLLLGRLLSTSVAIADDSTGIHPTLVERLAPYYSAEAIHLLRECTTIVHVSLDVHGVLHNFAVQQSSGYPGLD